MVAALLTRWVPLWPASKLSHVSTRALRLRDMADLSYSPGDRIHVGWAQRTYLLHLFGPGKLFFVCPIGAALPESAAVSDHTMNTGIKNVSGVSDFGERKSAYWPRGDSASSAGSSGVHSLFSGIPGGFANHLGGHPLPGAFAMMSGRGGPGGGYHHPPTTASGTYGGLGTLSVAASQAASLGINPTSAAWWTMASHLAAQDYLVRLQASGMSFGGLTGAESLLPGYPMLGGPHSQPHGNFLKQVVWWREVKLQGYHHNSFLIYALFNKSDDDPTSILGGVRLPPDTEIIKYTSSIVGPKIPGTTNRGRKKTISLDPPSVSVMPTHSSTGLLIERGGRKHSRSRLGDPMDYRETSIGVSSLDRDRVEVIKLPSLGSNGAIPLNIPSFGAGGNFSTSTPDSDAPLNLSLKPQASASNLAETPNSSITSNSSGTPHISSLSSLSNMSASLNTSTPTIPDRISRRKPGPKPRRVIQTSTPTSIPPSPSPSLAQLFAAADSPRPSSGSEENDSSSHKDGRPRNLGRGTSKPKKNTVASLLAQSHHDPGDSEDGRVSTSEDGDRRSTNNTPDSADKKRHLVGISSRSDDNKLKIRSVEGLSEDSSVADVSTDSGSASEGEGGLPSDSEEGDEGQLSECGTKREGDDDSGPANKKRKLEIDVREIRIPLEHGWRRETLISGVSRMGTIKGEVSYFTPCGRRFRQYPDVLRFLEKNNISDLTRENFSFSPKILVGDFLQPTGGDEPVRLSEEQVVRRLEELRATKNYRPHTSNAHRMEAARLAQEQKIQQQLEKEKAAMMAKEAKRVAKEEAARQKEHVRLLKEQERCERQEAIRKERELRNQQLMEGRKRLAFTLEQKMHIIREIEKGKSKSDVSRELGLASSTVATIWKNRESVYSAYENNIPKSETPPSQQNNVNDDEPVLSQTETARRRRQEELDKQRQEEQLRKQQERELKRQQAALIKEQERERRRQHMMLVKTLECRKRLEERERKRQEMRAEKLASKERKIEQRRIELELVKELRKPAEDMELTGDHRPLPTLNRIPGLKLSGQAFADTLMVFEFLHNFGETLGFDMDSLPTLNSLQMALLNDEEAEEELLSVMTHLLVCAIEDPGIPNPARHTTILGQSLKQADITHSNLSEILRIYLYANATGEVKALTGLHFERDREKKSDHHNNYGEVFPPCGKNAAFFEHLHNNPTWHMSEWLNEKPFLALNPTHKSAILAFLCNELLQNKAVIRQIDISIETVAQLRKDRWLMDTKLRKLRMLHGRKIRQPALLPVKLENSGCEESIDLGVEGKVIEEEVEVEDDVEEAESGNESEGTQPEEEEDKNLTAEELTRKMERLVRQSDHSLHALNSSAQQLRAVCFGQDRFWRRYWSLPCAGGIFVEAMESAEPEVFINGGKEHPDSCQDRLKAEAVGKLVKNEDNKCETELTKCEQAVDDSESDEIENEHRKKRTREKEEDMMDFEASREEEDVAKGHERCEEKMEVCEERSLIEKEHEKETLEAECDVNETEPKVEDWGVKESAESDKSEVRIHMCERTGEVREESVDLSRVKVEVGEVKNSTTTDHSLAFLLDKKPAKLKCESLQTSDKNCVKMEVKEDSLSAVKIEIKSDLFSVELNARKTEDKYIENKDKSILFVGKSQSVEADDKFSAAFLVHKPIQFERLGECMEKANSELGPVIVPNGDKFNALSHLYSASIFNNGKELNGGFLLGGVTSVTATERNWFSIVPRDSCDLTSVTNGSTTSRCLEGSTELRIPVFPPPSRLSSPSPASSQCESPAPLILTPEEMVQLEQLKKTGPLEPADPKPVPYELQRGWWRIMDEDQVRTILGNLHSRGVRERELKRVINKYIDTSMDSSGKMCLPGDKTATDLAITPLDSKVSALPGGAPLVDVPSDWLPEVALRVDLAVLDQVETLEDKVANASMQVKGWKVPQRATTEEGAIFRPSCLPKEGESDSRLDPVLLAKERLMCLEAAIERRYLKPPLGVSTGDVNLCGMSGESPPSDEVPKGLVVWREAVGRAHTSAQIAMALYMLEASIAWDKSIMKAVSSVSYCYECMNKATGERNCIVCGKKTGKNLVTCDLCPRAYHTDCLTPPLTKVPRGKWYCPTCQSKQPKKRGGSTGRRSTNHNSKARESESSEPAPSSPPSTPSAGTAPEDPPPSPPVTPNKKERNKKLLKDLNPCRILLEDLESHDEAWPFLLPVNTKQFPTYRKIIKTPMDLSTIKRKLQDLIYKSREDFVSDVRQIFNNCETFNEDDSPVGKAGHSMRLFFENRWGELNGGQPKPASSPL
uniref:Bromodomain adjacent to zinc finger domain protein 2B n=1 Tax=Timema monikensis TaxID=170555 RepID=A0A7R9E8Z8_9NEOP|nr:unnamed protein product [Timema monikensis]